ncbi:hypothetical protein [Citrobacter koseri]|uniref:hypothetical protein n=1 Tax=Citrobacter koseri TaxID=545 RepID=UPI001D885A96|nr:hypothetical protein [Citrobacter koseri]CAG0243988.1 hypothetical protein AN2353V1_1739 [Citrobacter koseri]CAH6036490.1 hypothetical protein AN2353V1_1739 [Citrobacter koseri]
MSDIYQITLTTQTGETFTGQWLYFAPADVKRVEFTPVPVEEEPNGDVQTVS